MIDKGEEILLERYELASHRIREIEGELSCAGNTFLSEENEKYFRSLVLYLKALLNGVEEYQTQDEDGREKCDMDVLLSVLFWEMRTLEVFIREACLYDIVIRLELFLEIYTAFSCEWQENRRIPEYETIRRILYWFAFDYSDVAAEQYVEEMSGKEKRHIYLDSDSMLYGFLPYAGMYDKKKTTVISCIWDRTLMNRKLEVFRTALDKNKHVKLDVKNVDFFSFAEMDGCSKEHRKILQEYCQQMKKVVAQLE